MLVNKKKFIHIFVTFILAVFICFYFFYFDTNSELEFGLKKTTLLSIVIYIWLLYSSYSINNGINIYLIIIILTIPFYLGDQLSLILGYKELMLKSDHSILDGIISNESIFKAMFYMIECLLFLHVGYLSSQKGHFFNNTEYANVSINTTQIKQMNFTGWIIYILTIIPTIVIRVYDVFMSIKMGHLAYRLYGSVSGVLYYFDYIADWFIPGCLIILIFNNTVFEKKVASVSVAIYFFLYLLSGKRMEIIGAVFAIACVYLYWYKIKISKNNIFGIIISSIVIIFIFQIVGNMRNASGGIKMFSIESIEEALSSNFLYGVFETTGNTFTSIANTIECVPSRVDFNKGKSLLGAILYLFPSTIREPYLSHVITHISAKLSPFYYGWEISGYGSSFITELFFNFGYYGLLISILYGIIVGKVVNSIENVNLKQPFTFYLCIYLLLEIVQGVRNDLYFIPRHLFLYVFMPYIFSRFLVKKTSVY